MKKQENKKATDSENSKQKKKYQKPQLKDHGNLHELTHVQTKEGTKSDGGGNPKTRV